MGAININLKTAADSMASRSTKGIVMLVLADTVSGLKKYNRKKAIKDSFTDDNKKLIDRCFDKYSPSQLKVICYNAANTETLKTALDKIDGVKWNYLACPTATTDDDKKIISDFIKAQVKAKNYTVKACLNNYATADSENIVSNYIDTITVDGDTLTGAVYAVDHACMCATSGMKQGLSGKILPGVTAVTLIDDTKANDPEGIAELGQVGVVYDNDFEAFVLTDDVTTKKTIDESKEKEILKDRRGSEILSMMQDDIKVDFKTNWYDKYGNSYSNRKLYRDTLNTSYFKPLGRTGALNGDMTNQCELSVSKTRDYLEETLKVDTTDMKDEEILAYDIGHKVFAKARVYVLQNMTELDFDIEY